jgi:Fic family protein
MGIKNKNLIDMIRRNNDYFEDYVTRSVYHSNAIEGNTLSYYETYQIIFKCSSEEILSNVKPRELYEAINLKYAMDYIFNHIEEDVTASFLIDIGKIINKNISEISSFRTGPVFIMGAEHIPPNAADVPRLINELLFTSFKSDDFLTDLADFHIRYERIHPFGDGNGRSGRVLMNKIALSEGYAPFVIPKEERTQYMNLLAECNVNGLRNMIERLMKEETERMKQFNIFFEKTKLNIKVSELS